ncbi:MAG: DUF2071 domain-containing protein [Pirellulales bacterium]|nr:DUF2071 domain-containing protein [Pirellulales bacterium]
MASPFLTATWRHLVLLNWRVNEDLLVPHLPSGVELDRWDGDCWASLVGFQFLHMSVKGMPAFGYRNFPEINLRFYVKRQVNGETRRCVVFIREITPHLMVGWVARAIYNEPYTTMPMRQSVDESHARYQLQIDGQWQGLGVRSAGAWRDQDEAELFITEHYWGYNTQRNGDAMEYQVEHPTWRARSIEPDCLDLDIEKLYGEQWAQALGTTPDSMVFAEGSGVTVRSGVRI